jgi:hypothetical protein
MVFFEPVKRNEKFVVASKDLDLCGKLVGGADHKRVSPIGSDQEGVVASHVEKLGR